MRHSFTHLFCALLILLSCLVGSNLRAQSPGMIIRAATGAGRNILDPNLDGFISAGSNGFTGPDSDTTQNEIKYKVMKPVFYEPTSDLLRGPNTGYSDLVTAVDSSGFYVTSDGSRLLFRMRIGDYIPGSKGYTVFVDTDGRFGNAGLLADPGFTPPGNGRAGNPGFEFEISLQTNFQLAVYNTDTFGKIVLKYANTPVSDYSQVAVARSYTSGNPDYFIDFYVPFSQLWINANTPLRFAATTVVSPQPALGGPMSDIFGYGSYSDPMAAWTSVVQRETPVSPAALTAAAYIPVCTEAPVVTAPAVGASAVSGSWSRLDNTRAGTARIYLYRNGALTDSVTASSGLGWSIPLSSAVAAADQFSARAQGPGEGACFQSGTVTAVKCGGVISGRPANFVSCVSNKGMDGTFTVSGTRVRVYQNVLPGTNLSGYTIYADSAAAPANFASVTTPFVLHDNTAKAWKCDGLNGNGQPGTISNSACTGGSSAADMPANTPMAVTAQEPGKCESAPVFICPNGTVTAMPTVSGTVLLPGASVKGTAVAGSYMRLYVDSVLRGSVYADAGGAYSFGNPGLLAGSRVEVYAQATTTPASCVSAAVVKTVQVQTTPPVITTDATGYLMPAATAVGGTSSEVNNTTVFLYKRVGTAVTSAGQATVTNGSWNLSGITALASGDTYLATQQAPGNALSDTSNLGVVPAAATNSCATFAQASYPANAGSVSGTVSPALSNGKVYLYIDGALADSVGNVTSSFSIATNTTVFNRLYSGAVLTVTARATGGAEKLGCGAGSNATVTCSSFPAPVLSLNPAVIRPANATSATGTNAASGLLYTLIASPDNGTVYGNAAFASGNSIGLTTYNFANTGSYPMTLRAVNLAEGGSCIMQSNLATLVVTNGPLPLQLLSFTARREPAGVRLNWTVNEVSTARSYTVERSEDGTRFMAIGAVLPHSGAVSYTYLDQSATGGIYRLRVEAGDGSASFSPQVRVTAEGNAILQPAASPNPFHDRLSFRISVNRNGQATIRLLTIDGRIVRTQQAPLTPGLNEIKVPELGGLPQGNYTAEILIDDMRQGILKVVKY